MVENLACVLVAFICIVIWICYTLFEEYWLQNQIDGRSRIKIEARKTHQKQDHNTRLTEKYSHRLTSNPESLFLWACDDIDDEFFKMKRTELEQETKNGKVS